MRFSILKCHGSGNDFPLIDATTVTLDDHDWAQVARALADRAGPVGGDGLLLMTAGDQGTGPGRAAFGFRMFNADGSEAETCLNGLRCVGRVGFEALGIEHAEVRLRTSRAVVARDPELAPGVVTIRETAGPASLDAAAWPIVGVAGTIIDAPVAMLDSERRFTAVAMPNPHLVTFVNTVDEAELGRIGTVCEAAPAWLPNRANVSFVRMMPDSSDLFVRTFERGVGLTDSCGSAMAASTFAACLTDRVAFGQEITVFNRGGLVRAQAERDGVVRLSGNATFEWQGSIAVDLALGTAYDLIVERRFEDEIAAWARIVAATGRQNA